MSESRRILMFSFLMLLLNFPAAEMKSYSLTVRAGDEVTLPSDHVIHDQDKCENTTWIFKDSSRSSSRYVILFADGQILKAAKAKSDRLRVTQNCSLVIEKVTEEDAGRYICRQIRSGGQRSDSQVSLSVVSMTEHQGEDEVTLRCSVKGYRGCIHSVKWLLQGGDVDRDPRGMNTSQSLCSASVTFQTPLFSNTPRSELFTCEVTEKYPGNTGDVQLFPFSAQSSGDAITTGTPPIHEWTSNATTTGTPPIHEWTSNATTTGSPPIHEWTSGNSNKETGQDCKPPEGPAVWWVILVSVGLAALILSVVTVHIWTRDTGGQQPMTINLEQNDEVEEVDYAMEGLLPLCD